VGEESLVQPCVDSYRARYRELAARETTVFPGIRKILDEAISKAFRFSGPIPTLCKGSYSFGS
jgi:hypothetical protein